MIEDTILFLLMKGFNQWIEFKPTAVVYNTELQTVMSIESQLCAIKSQILV